MKVISGQREYIKTVAWFLGFRPKAAVKTYSYITHFHFPTGPNSFNAQCYIWQEKTAFIL